MPTKITAAQKKAVLASLMEGKALAHACAEPDMPSRATVFRELAANPEFAAEYAMAREVQADVIADEIIHLADTCEVNSERSSDLPAKAKLQIDARKWYAAKLKPKVYGDKFVAEVTTDRDIAAMLEAASKRVATLTRNEP